MTTPTSTPLDCFLDWQALRELIPVSRTTLWQWRRRGDFPAAVRLSAGRVAWRASDVRAWMESRQCQ